MTTKPGIKRKITDYVVQNGSDYDDVLHRPLFQVDPNLFMTSRYYQNLIFTTHDALLSMFAYSYVDYDTLKGVSGANLGIPFNMIAVPIDKKITVCLNPKYEVDPKDRSTRVVKSNCGSLRLKNKVACTRFNSVIATFYVIEFDTEPITIKKVVKTLKGAEGSTFQHEVDHNNGILITDTNRS